MESAIVFLTTLIAAILSSMSGGGTGMIVYPVFLSLGMPLPLVVATSLVNSTFWVLPASYNYLKGRVVDWKFIIFFSGIGLVGSYLAFLLVISLEQRIFEIIVGTIIVSLAAYTYLRKELGLFEKRTYPQWRQALAYPFALLQGFYENAFGAGNGIAFTLLTHYTKGFDFIDALGHYYAIAFPWCLFGAFLLIQQGYYDLNIMMFSVIGSLAGAYVGSKYAKCKGNKFIKTLFVTIGGILGLKLLLGF